MLRSTAIGEELFFNLRVSGDFSWMILLLATWKIHPPCYLQQFTQFATSVANVRNIIDKLDASKVCAGNGDPKFSILSLGVKARLFSAMST